MSEKQCEVRSGLQPNVCGQLAGATCVNRLTFTGTPGGFTVYTASNGTYQTYLPQAANYTVKVNDTDLGTTNLGSPFTIGAGMNTVNISADCVNDLKTCGFLTILNGGPATKVNQIVFTNTSGGGQRSVATSDTATGAPVFGFYVINLAQGASWTIQVNGSWGSGDLPPLPMGPVPQGGAEGIDIASQCTQ